MQASDVNVVSSCKTAAKICSRRHSHFASRERKNTANLPYKPRSGQSTPSEHVSDTFSLFFLVYVCAHTRTSGRKRGIAFAFQYSLAATFAVIMVGASRCIFFFFAPFPSQTGLHKKVG